MKLFEVLLLESPASEKLETDVARHINKLKKVNGIVAKKAGATGLSDIYLKHGSVSTYLEVKMNHKDNLSNPRVFFDGKKWDTTYKTPVAKYAVDELNKSAETKAFINELKRFLGVKKLKLPTTKGGLKDPDAVPLDVLKDFLENQRGHRYIMNLPNINIGKLVTKHYLEGKDAPAHYMQSADDFYLIGTKDPLGLNKVNSPPIPKLSGTGDFRMRISTRSQYYEIQAEVKIKKFAPSTSPYSAKPKSDKINPFENLKVKK